MNMLRVNDYIGLALAGVCLTVYVYDLLAGTMAGDGHTVSEILISTSRDRPVVPFLLGLLAGHLIWPQH